VVLQRTRGDFVLTLGGYHPQFHPPAHYPQVHCSGFELAFSDSLALKCDSLLRAHPHAIIAGGNLEAAGHEDRSGHGSMPARFSSSSWQPYYYDAHSYVSIVPATPLTLSATTPSPRVGEGSARVGSVFLRMTADVHWYVFSDTYQLHSHPQPPPTITWSVFKKPSCRIRAACEVHAIPDCFPRRFPELTYGYGHESASISPEHHDTVIAAIRTGSAIQFTAELNFLDRPFRRFSFVDENLTRASVRFFEKRTGPNAYS